MYIDSIAWCTSTIIKVKWFQSYIICSCFKFVIKYIIKISIKIIYFFWIIGYNLRLTLNTQSFKVIVGYIILIFWFHFIVIRFKYYNWWLVCSYTWNTNNHTLKFNYVISLIITCPKRHMTVLCYLYFCFSRTPSIK